MTTYWKANGERDWVRETAERNWQREQEEHRAWLERKPTREEIEFSVWIFSLPIKALFWPLTLAIRHGYGKHLLFLFFVAPIILFVGACVVALVMGVHAHPQVFLGNWQTYVAQHPGAAHWTWLVRDLTQWIHAC